MTRSNAFTLAAIMVVLLVTDLEAGAQGTVIGMKPDQVNVAGWDKAWTNLVNDVEQTFVPSSAKLVAVEVQLALGNPGPGGDKLTLTILDTKGQAIASVTRFVSVSVTRFTSVPEFEHAVFVIPDGGIEIDPGETYSIKLSGGTTFGWKYVVGGYPKGAATFNGKPLLPNARSTFLLRTFGPA